MLGSWNGANYSVLVPTAGILTDVLWQLATTVVWVGKQRIMFALDSRVACLLVSKEAPGTLRCFDLNLLPNLFVIDRALDDTGCPNTAAPDKHVKNAYWTAVHIECWSNTCCLLKGIDLSWKRTMYSQQKIHLQSSHWIPLDPPLPFKPS